MRRQGQHWPADRPLRSRFLSEIVLTSSFRRFSSSSRRSFSLRSLSFSFLSRSARRRSAFAALRAFSAMP